MLLQFMKKKTLKYKENSVLNLFCFKFQFQSQFKMSLCCLLVLT